MRPRATVRVIQEMGLVLIRFHTIRKFQVKAVPRDRWNEVREPALIDGDLQWKGGEITDLRRVIDGLIAVRYWSEGP